MSNKKKRLICFIASMFLSIGVPLIVTIIKYDIIKAFAQQRASVKVSIIGAIIICILFFVFFKKLVKYLSGVTFSYTLAIVKGIVKIVPLICIMLVLINMINYITDFVFVFGWITGCNIIAKIGIDPLVDKYTDLVKREEQKQIVKEALNEDKA